MGGDGSANLRWRWSQRGEQREGEFAQYDPQGTLRAGGAQEQSAGGGGCSDTQARRRAQAADRNGSRHGAGAESIDRTEHSGRSDVAVAVDLQEHAESCPSADAAWTSGRRLDGRGHAEAVRL